MPYSIDTSSYRKDTHLPVGVGWSMRPSGLKPITIVIHTTSSLTQDTKFENEAAYLYNSRDVSAHYLNGKAGQIVQFLHPDLEAWHAGVSISSFGNDYSVGIENHVSVGEPWTQTQHESLTWLVRRLMAQYQIVPGQIETHRAIALPGPNIRKHDPTSWDDVSFYAWRARLAPPAPRFYQCLGLPVYQRSDHTGVLWGHLFTGEQITIDDVSNGHLADGRGFVDMQGLKLL